MKRSNFTDYTYDDSIIFEYGNKYFIMEMCQQGNILNPAHGSRQLASDISSLSSSIKKCCTSKDLGEAVLNALDNFDVKGHPYDQYNLAARNKYIASLVGARGLPSLERDSRQVYINRYLKQDCIIIRPTDNCNINPFIDLLESIKLPSTASPDEIGQAIFKAFSLSTFHPKCKPIKN